MIKKMGGNKNLLKSMMNPNMAGLMPGLGGGPSSSNRLHPSQAAKMQAQMYNTCLKSIYESNLCIIGLNYSNKWDQVV